MNRSAAGSHRSFRPRRIEMFPKCAGVIERCATSAGAAVIERDLTQSMKFP
jgi:hypothetical protein